MNIALVVSLSHFRKITGTKEAAEVLLVLRNTKLDISLLANTIAPWATVTKRRPKFQRDDYGEDIIFLVDEGRVKYSSALRYGALK